MNARVKLELPTISFEEGTLLADGRRGFVGEEFEGVDIPAGMEGVGGVDGF